MDDKLKDYHDIVAWVWKYFKKYYLEYDADLALEELQEFVNGYKHDDRLHDFALQTSKIAWREVGQLYELTVNG